MALMDNEEVYLNRKRTRRVADISTEMAKIAYADVSELLEAAEAKAYWGLAVNYEALQVLAEELAKVESLTGDEVAELLEGAGVKKFEVPFVEGFEWGADGSLVWPDRTDKPTTTTTTAAGGASSGNGSSQNGGNGSSKAPAWWSPRNPYTVRSDIADMLADTP